MAVKLKLMNVKLNKFTLTILFVFTVLPLFSQGTSFKANELSYEDLDRAYNEVNYKIVKGDAALRNAGSLENLILIEEREIKYRKNGLVLWKYCPTDKRRFEWLKRTVMNEKLSIFYWKDINEGAKKFLFRRPYSEYDVEIDKIALLEWESYYGKMKNEYFQYYYSNGNFEKVNEDKQMFSLRELESFLKNSLNKEFRTIWNPMGKFDMDKMTLLFLAASSILEDSSSLFQAEVLRAMDNDFLSCYQELGISLNELDYFINAIKLCKCAPLRKWASQRSELLNLRHSPFLIKADTIDNRYIDTSNMKGQVILVDFWATSCLSCIERMPYLLSLYNKYHDKGFEVISACYNFGDEKKEILELTNKLGVSWPTLLIGGTKKDDESRSRTLGGRIWEKYGFFGVPQMFLLDKEGRLVAFNGELRNGNFEPLLIDLLNK